MYSSSPYAAQAASLKAMEYSKLSLSLPRPISQLSSKSLPSLPQGECETNPGVYRRYKVIERWQTLIRRWIQLQRFMENFATGTFTNEAMDYKAVEGWADDFNHLLHSKNGKGLLLEFLNIEHAEENLYFWEAVEVFRTMEDADQRKEFSIEIYKQFLAKNAPTPLNFDAETKREVDINYTACPASLYDSMQRHIHQLLKRDKWMRFLQSQLYNMCMVRTIPQYVVDKWKDDFNALMETRLGKSLLSQFLDTQFARENLDFWDAVQEYRSKWDSQRHAQRKRGAERVWKMFLDVHSSTEISIDSVTRERLASKLKEDEPDKDIFDDAMLHIHDLLEKDCYPRFLRSPTFNNFLEQHNKISQTSRTNSA